MDELIAQVVAMGRSMWRRRWIGVLVAWIVAAVAAVALWRTPDRYEATARVFVDSKSVLKPLMQDLAVEPDIEQTIGLLAKTLINRPNVDLLMRKAKLETPEMTPAEREQKIDRLIKTIKLTGSGRDNVFSFSYSDIDPVRARTVVENLVALFVESDLGAKARDTESARGFIDQQIRTYEGRLIEAENRLKEFKLRNIDLTNTAGNDYFARIAALNEEVNKLTLDLRAAEQSRDALKRELSGENMSLLSDVPAQAVVPTTTELDARIDTQRRQLDELLRRYTDLHPDVVATRRLIARLEEQREQEIETARKKAAEAKPGRSSGANPVIQQVKLALAESEASVAALRSRLADMQGRLAQLRATASRVPQVEAELAQLNRDYDIVRQNYEALVARREKASMSEEVDNTRLAKFRVIDPPRTSEKPVFPNRLALVPVALIVALVAGVIATYLMTQLVPTFNSGRALRLATQRPVLGSVSMRVPQGAAGRLWRERAAFASAVSGLVLVYGAWMAWMVSHATRV
jgi:polysaccharide chain length determinant protein (PEP-CTERM system associated)